MLKRLHFYYTITVTKLQIIEYLTIAVHKNLPKIAGSLYPTKSVH
jgi:hypothetical protein